MWLSVSSIAIVLMLCAPVSKYTHATISVICLALLVAPVTSNPTGPLNIALAVGFAFVYLVVQLVVKSKVKARSTAARSQSFKLTRKRNSNRNTVEYNAVPNPMDESDGGIEMGRTDNTNPVPSLSGVTKNANQNSQSEHEENMRGESNTPIQNGGALGWGVRGSIWLNRRMLILPFCGLLLGFIGLIFFALQSRTNYSVLHSLWHVSMMLSAYLIVRGKMEFGKQ